MSEVDCAHGAPTELELDFYLTIRLSQPIFFVVATGNEARIRMHVIEGRLYPSGRDMTTASRLAMLLIFCRFCHEVLPRVRCCAVNDEG